MVTGLGYGVVVGPAWMVNISNYHATNCRHAITTTNESQGVISGFGVAYTRAQNVTASGSVTGRYGKDASTILSSAFDTHPASKYFEIDGFYIDNYPIGFNSRSDEIVIKNGIFKTPPIEYNKAGSAHAFLVVNSTSADRDIRKIMRCFHSNRSLHVWLIARNVAR